MSPFFQFSEKGPGLANLPARELRPTHRLRLRFGRGPSGPCSLRPVLWRLAASLVSTTDANGRPCSPDRQNRLQTQPHVHDGGFNKSGLCWKHQREMRG